MFDKLRRFINWLLEGWKRYVIIIGCGDGLMSTQEMLWRLEELEE